MTIYSISGFAWNETSDSNDNLTISNIRYAQLDVGFLGTDSAVTVRQVGVDTEADEPLPVVEFDSDSYMSLLDGQDLDNFSGLEFAIIDLGWGTGSGVVLNAYNEGFTTSTSYVFSLGGDPLPSFSDEDALLAFIETDITVNAPDAGTGFAPGETFNLADLPNFQVNENDNYIDFENNHANVDTGLGNDTIDGAGGNDTLYGGVGNDSIIGSAGHDSLFGGAGTDTARIFSNYGDAVIEFQGDDILISHFEQDDPQRYTDTLNGFEVIAFNDINVNVTDLYTVVNETGDENDNTIQGQGNNDRLDGGAGNDTLDGGNGSDTLIGGEGNDDLLGGSSDSDRRDVLYGGSGDDRLDGGYGNDEIRGDSGNDTLTGGFGADRLIGGTGDDRMSSGALGDELFGGDGNDFLNGGFGYDRMNGGTGADDFFHLGIADHGSDWIQDYHATEGDVLVFGQAGAAASQFQINSAFTEGAGDDAVADAFVIYRPTGQILWALVDGMGEDSINIVLGGETFDLMA